MYMYHTSIQISAFLISNVMISFLFFLNQNVKMCLFRKIKYPEIYCKNSEKNTESKSL